MSEDIQQIAETAKKKFDLSERVKGKSRRYRSGSIKLFTDEDAGQRLGDARDIKTDYGLVVDRVQEGLLGELDKLTSIDVEKFEPSELKAHEAAIADLEAQIEAVKAELDETAIVVHLRGLPDIIKSDCRRAAKETLGIHGKVPEDEERWGLTFNSHLLSRSATTVTDFTTGDGTGKLDYEGANELLGNLPSSEGARLVQALSKVNYTAAVSEAVTDSADFSLDI
jgi:hypothetical protein